MEVSQGRTFRKKPEAESREEGWLLACFSWLAKLPFSIDIQGKDGSTHSGLGPPISISNLKNAPTDMPIIG